jgi:thioredoxin 1
MIMTDLRELHDLDFTEETKQGVVLVDFWAPWCAPCHMQGPILERVAAQVGQKATVAKLNVDEAPLTAGRLGIRSIPTLIVFKNGEPVDGSTLVRAL